MILLILATAAFSGTAAVFASWSVEHFGGRIGGALGSTPTTIVPAAVGIFLASEGSRSFTEAMDAATVGILGNLLFLFVWRALPPLLPNGWRSSGRLSLLIATSMTAWLISVMLSSWATRRLVCLQSPPAGTVGAIVTLLVITIGLLMVLRTSDPPRERRSSQLGWILARFFSTAAMVAIAVALSQWGHPQIAGLAAVFPAIFTTTMISLWLARGQDVTGGAAAPMMLGSAAVCVFCVAAGQIMPLVGAWVGALLSWAMAFITVTIPIILFERQRRNRSHSGSGQATSC